MLRYTMVSMNVPEPVMSLAVMPKARDGSGNLSKALNRCALLVRGICGYVPS
jgi:elongation factor G